MALPRERPAIVYLAGSSRVEPFRQRSQLMRAARSRMRKCAGSLGPEMTLMTITKTIKAVSVGV